MTFEFIIPRRPFASLCFVSSVFATSQSPIQGHSLLFFLRMAFAKVLLCLLLATVVGLAVAQVPSPLFNPPVYPKNPDPLPYSWWDQWWWLALLIFFGVEIVCLVVLGYLIFCWRRNSRYTPPIPSCAPSSLGSTTPP